MRSTLLILLVAALATVAAADDDFQDFKDSFRASFRPSAGGEEGPTWEDRLAAVEGVATFRNEDSTRLLVTAIQVVEKEIQTLLELREAIRTGRDKASRGKLPEPYLAVVKVKIDGELQVFEAIENGFAKLTDEKAIAYLARDVLPRHRYWKCRAVVARVLGRIGDRAYIEFLAKALGDKDPRVRTSILLALGKMRAEEALEQIMKALGDKDWTVRSAAVEALGRLRDPRSFEALLARMQKEDGRLAEDCAEALKRITGQDFGQSVRAWEAWWAENKEKAIAGHWPEPPPPPEEEKEDDRYYHGIPVKSDRTIFIIDVSESMAYSAKQFKTKPKEGELSRLDVAKQELLRAVKIYDRKGTFGLISFHTVIQVWRPRLVPAKKTMKEDAVEWAGELTPTGTTNIYGALEAAFRMSGMGMSDKYYQPAADTIFILSDGAPTNQDLTNDDPDRILRAVRGWNSLGRMRIHTIGLLGHSEEFMSKLAEQNGGTYISRE